MNIIEIKGNRYSLDDDLVWHQVGGAPSKETVGLLQATTDPIETGPHFDPTPAGHIAFLMAKKYNGRILQQDDAADLNVIH